MCVSGWDIYRNGQQQQQQQKGKERNERERTEK
jgi:hypothetical protein